MPLRHSAGDRPAQGSSNNVENKSRREAVGRACNVHCGIKAW